jgi:hypothetical protein
LVRRTSTIYAQKHLTVKVATHLYRCEAIMSNRKLMITSVCLLAVLGLRGAVYLPAVWSSAIKSGVPASFTISHTAGTVLATAIWLVLAFCQWRNGGGWSLGIGIFALASLAGQSLIFYIAVTSGRVKIETMAMVSFLFFTVGELPALAGVNFWLYAKQKRKSA